MRPRPGPPATVLALATVLQLLAYGFAYWFAHYCFHKVPILWEFHKVHHSAEVLTALTELRQHPVEIIAFMNAIGLSTGIVFGAMTYGFGPGVRPFTLFDGNILMVTFLVSYGHLRHSHMWIAFTGVAGRILQSPAHHRLHHSTNPAHFGRNLGFALALGTGRSARSRFRPRCASRSHSASAKAPPFRSALTALVSPFARFAGHAVRGARNDRAPPGRCLAHNDDDRPSGAPPIELRAPIGLF